MSKGNQLTFLDNSQDALTPKHEPIPIAKKKPAKKRISPHKPVPPDAYSNHQLCLFQDFLANTNDERDQLGNAFDLWDSVPRFSITRKRQEEMRLPSGALPICTIDFKYRGNEFKILIRPARLKDPITGEEKEHYPGAREELVEHALRKIAVDDGFYDVDGFRSGCRFTLHRLRTHLADQGHTLRYDELTEALDILSLSNIDIQGETDDAEVCYTRMNYLSLLARVSKKDHSVNNSQDSKWLIQFHPLITNSISNLTYRQFNYRRLMKCRTQLSRWLISQLVLKYTQASLTNNFIMRYSTIKRDSALLEGYKRERDAIATLDASWDELKSLGVLTSYTKAEERGKRAKIVDVVYTIFPSPQFTAEQKASNRRLINAKKSIEEGIRKIR
ncbi:replication protein (plasmid) [Methylomonas sp. LL1]|uniref:replication protein n=1 Tax=Methylomonas sp. LL1 TaxID=2785785 RepID=UPI0018C37D3A|nr:replication protein [Methylomonas sp. LL1]QPK61415.1 replication protein [Methylomonas sp. LL1]